MKALTFNRYQCYPLQARVLWAQKVLINLGYDKVEANGRREKPYIKAMIKFQKENGLAGNAMVCEKTFDLLMNNGGRKVDINI